MIVKMLVLKTLLQKFMTPQLHDSTIPTLQYNEHSI